MSERRARFWPKSGSNALTDLERVARSGKVETGAALRILWDVGLLQEDLKRMCEEAGQTAYAAGFAEGAALAGKRASRSMGFKDGYWESMERKGKR